MRALGIFFAALVARGFILSRMWRLPLVDDEVYYWKYATRTLEDAGLYWLRPPLWGGLLTLPAAWYSAPVAARVLAIVLGALTAVAVYWMGREVFGAKTGIAAGLLFAIFPEHVFFSTYLFKETLFGLFVASAGFLFARFANDPHRRGSLFLAAFLAGLSVLCSEFGVVCLFAMLAAMAFGRFPRKRFNYLVVAGFFLAPALVYSIAATRISGRWVAVDDAPLGNFRQAVGLKFSDAPGGWSFKAGSIARDASRLFDSWRTRSMGDVTASFKENVSSLWGPSSFPVWRIYQGHYQRHDTSGGLIPGPESWARLIVWSYVLLMMTGLAGICTSPPGLFRVYSSSTLILLSCTGVVAYLVSRFRLPFVSLPVLYSAYFFTNLRTALPRLKDRRVLAVLVPLLILFAVIVDAKYATIGKWG